MAKQQVWPCSFCTFHEVARPSDFGRDNVNAYRRIIAHERDRHPQEVKRK